MAHNPYSAAPVGLTPAVLIQFRTWQAGKWSRWHTARVATAPDGIYSSLAPVFALDPRAKVLIEAKGHQTRLKGVFR